MQRSGGSKDDGSYKSGEKEKRKMRAGVSGDRGDCWDVVFYSGCVHAQRPPSRCHGVAWKALFVLVQRCIFCCLLSSETCRQCKMVFRV